MAVTVTFADGTTICCAKSAFCNTMEHQGMKRKYLEMYFNSSDIALSELKNIYTNANMTSEITTKMTYTAEEQITNEDNTTSTQLVEKTSEQVHLNMTMPVSLGYSTQPDGTELVAMRLAQMSDMEIMQAQQAEEIELTQAALIEALAMIGG